MSFFDPSFLPPLPVVEEERTFTAVNGQEFTIAFRVSDGGDMGFATREEVERITARYLRGGESVGTPPVRVTELMCEMIAQLIVCQVKPQNCPLSPDGQPLWIPWGFAHWAILMQRDPATFFDIYAFHQSLMRKAAGLPEDDTGDDPKNE